MSFIHEARRYFIQGRIKKFELNVLKDDSSLGRHLIKVIEVTQVT